MERIIPIQKRCEVAREGEKVTAWGHGTIADEEVQNSPEAQAFLKSLDDAEQRQLNKKKENTKA